MNINKNILYFLRQTNVKHLQLQMLLLIHIIYFIVTNVSKETPYRFSVIQNKLSRILVSAIYAIIRRATAEIYKLCTWKKEHTAFK